MTPSVCAVLITFNRLTILKKALAHVISQDHKPSKIIIVDNNSTDGTQEYLRSLSDDSIQCIYLTENIGSAGGIAIGMEEGLKAGNNDYFWILDDDTFYAPTMLHDLVESIEESPYAFVGLTGSLIKYGTKKPAIKDLRLQKVDYALIDGALIKANVVKEIGPVNKDFFMMCDDHEYCMRIQKHGHKVGLLNLGHIERLYLGGEGSFTKATLWRGYYSSRNMMFIVKNYFTFFTLLGYIYRQSKLIAAAALYAPDRFTRVKFRLLGIWHGITGRGGKTLDPVTLQFSN